MMAHQATRIFKRERRANILQMICCVLSVWLTSTTGQLTQENAADFQLTGGTISNYGRLEVRLTNTTEWVGVCKSSFYPLYASVICRDLGWYSACQSLTTSEGTSAPAQSSSIVTLQARCLGWESSLWDCDDVSFSDSTCKPGEDVWLVCLREPNDLDVRLSDGNFEGEGYVEMRCPGQKWNTVCVPNWDMRDADTVCRQLGYPWSYSISPDGEPGVTLGEIGYSNFLCTGNETFIGECAFTQEQECSDNFDVFSAAGVQCGVELNQQMANIPVTLCDRHHCGGHRSGFWDECRCDCQCTRFNDCCYDFPNQNITCDASALSVYKGVDPSLYECSPGPLSSFYKTAYVLITKCPNSSSNTSVKALCEMHRDFNDVIGLLPVYDSNGRVFKNVFCAVCHGLTVQDVTNWGMSLNYDPSKTAGGGYINPSLIIVVPGELIGFELLPPRDILEIRQCPYGQIDSCPSNTTDANLNYLCASYFAPVTFDNMVLYRNPHCAICNGVQLPETQYCEWCPDMCPTDPFLPCVGAPCEGTVPLERANVQFSLDAFFEGVYGEAEQITCPTGELYDPFLRQCTAIPCSPSFNRPQEMCIEANKTKSTPSSTVGDDEVTVPSTTTKVQMIHPTLYCLLQEIGFEAQLEGIELTISSPVYDSQTLDIFTADCLHATPVSLSVVFEDYTYAFPLLKAFDTELTNNNKDECPLCNISNINVYLERQRAEIAGPLKDRCTMFYESVVLDGMMNSSLVALSKYNLTGNILEAPDFCLQEKQLTCVTTKFSPSGYQIIHVNRSLWLLDYNISLQREDYIFHKDGTVEVCSSLLLTPWSQRPIFEIAVVGCIGLSIVALLVIFIVYIADSALRDVAGKCLINMFVAFIFGLTLSVVCELFLFHHIACTTIAAVGHFVWLAAFCWMTLFASVIAIGIDGSTGYVFCKMFGFGWIVPAVAVGLCLWIHFCQCMNVDISYGEGVTCWLQGPEAVLFALVVPVTVLLLVCTIAFICGAIRVRKVREFVTAFSEEITESTVSDVILYIVLCLLLLIPWILAITYLLFKINILYDIHRIAYALQGVFIVATLLCTDKVRALCKKKPAPVVEDAPAGVTRQLSKRLDAPDGASNRVWMKRDGGNGDAPGSINGENTWL